MPKFVKLTILLTLAAFPSARAADFISLDPGLQKAAERQWNQNGFSETRIRQVQPSTSFAIRSPLNMMILKGSSWTEPVLLAHLRQAEQIYAQCRVSFDPITWIETKSPVDVQKLDTDFDVQAEVHLFRPELLQSKPTVMFKEKGGSYSWLLSLIVSLGFDQVPGAYDLIGNAVVPYQSYQTNLMNKPAHPDYNVLAHELAHVLLDRGHNAIDNDILCGTYDCKGTHFSDEECQTLRDRLTP